MKHLILSLALLAETRAAIASSHCAGDQCNQPPPPAASTKANTLLQISKEGKLTKIDEQPVDSEATGHKQDTQTRKSGAQWTEEEAMIVMGKIHYTLTMTSNILESPLFENYECMSGPNLSLPCNNSHNKYCHVDVCKVDNTPELDNLFAKYVRLGFHTCFKYEDGSGGCNGCMWFGDMFGKFVQLHGSANQDYGASTLRSYEDREDSAKNNGLSAPADVLEAIYTDKDYPPDAWPLDVSLKDSGKSRADLWAFAGLMSAEYAMNTNNLRCKGEGLVKPTCEHNYAHIPLEFPCEITVDTPPTFYTGRSDCSEDDKPSDPLTSSVVPHRARAYETIKPEMQPSANMNGLQVASFMKTGFGFSYQETVALMGAHAIGGFKFWHSMRKYNWQRGNAHLLNNNYYRIMMGKPAKFLSCGLGNVPPTNAGKPGGELAETGWWVRPLRELKSGGPYLWFHYYKRCPTCYKEGNKWVSVEQRGDTKFKSEECCICNEQTEDEVDPECYVKVTQDETAINSDMGLYYDFEVGRSGIPLNCPGIPSDTWNEDRLADVSLDSLTGAVNGGINTWDTEPSCPRNTVKEEGDDKSLSDYVELYAENQNVWAKDFFAAFEKMLGNGYEPGELREGPQVLGIGKATCGKTKMQGKRGKMYGCVLETAAEASKPAPRPSGGKGRR